MTCARMTPFQEVLKQLLLITHTEEEVNQAVSLLTLRKETIRARHSVSAIKNLKPGQILLTDRVYEDIDPNKFGYFESDFWFNGKTCAKGEWTVDISNSLMEPCFKAQAKWIGFASEILLDPHLARLYTISKMPSLSSAKIDPVTGKLLYADMPIKMGFTVYYPIVQPQDLEAFGVYYYLEDADTEELCALIVDKEKRTFVYDLVNNYVDIYKELDPVELLDNGEAFFVLLKFESYLESNSKRQRR